MVSLNLFKKYRSTIVVDVISVLESLGIKDNFSPRTQLQILRRLARFSDRENIKVIAVLSGKPLHKAPKGKMFDSILVLYSRSLESHARKIAKIAISRNGILVTNNINAEKRAGSRIAKMRLSTFRKVLDLGSEFDINRSDGYRYEKNRRFKTSNNRYRKQQASSAVSQKSNQSDDAINDLIDLVD